MISNISYINKLLESLRKYLDDTNYNLEYNLGNIINYYYIDDFDDLNNRFIASYENEDEMIHNIPQMITCERSSLCQVYYFCIN